MGRQTHTPTAYHSVFNAYSANAADIVMTAADVGNKDQVLHTGKEIVVCHNTSGAAAKTVTFTSANNDNRRTGDITTYSIGIGEYAIFGPFPLHGWLQSDGYLYFEGESVDVKFGVYRIE